MRAEDGVHLVREILAPQAAVFDAWLDPRILTEFLKPVSGMQVTDVQVDPTEGGSFHLTMVAGETLIPVRGVYRRISPHTHLSFTWLSHRTSENSLVELTFEAIDVGKTRLTLRHKGFPSDESRDNHQNGWLAIVEKLGEELRSVGIQN